MKSNYLNKFYNQKLISLNHSNFFCYQNCQKLLLDAQGLKHTMLYLNLALSFNYNKKNNDIYFDYESFSLLPSLESNVKHFFIDNKLEMVTEIFIQNIKHLFNHKLPIIVGVDSFYLKYSLNYQKMHTSHVVILCGYNLHKNEVYIIDWIKPYYFKGWIPLDFFLAARNSNFSSRDNIQNNWAFIDKINVVNIEKLFFELLEITVSNYYTENKNNDILKGVDAIYEIKNIALTNSQIYFNNVLYFKLLLISKRYSLFSEVLTYYKNNNIDLKSLETTIKIAKSQVSNWQRFLSLTQKKFDDRNVNLKKMIETNFDIIIANEKELKLNTYKLYEELANEYH